MAGTTDGGNPALVRARLVAGDFDGACGLAEQALADESCDPADRARLLLDWVRATTSTGRMDNAEDRLVEALELLPDAAGDMLLAQELRLELARIYALQGNLRHGLALASQVGAELEQSGTAELLARARSIRGCCLMRQRRYPEALEQLEAAHAFYSGHPGIYGAAQCEHWYAWSLIGAGEVEQGIALAEAQLERLQAAAQPNPHELSTILNTIIYGDFCRGNLRRVHDLAQAKLEIEAVHGSKPRMQISLYNMGLLALQIGELAAARERLLRCWVLTQELPDRRFIVEVAKLLAVVALHDGDTKLALEYIQQGQDGMRALGLEAQQTYEWFLAPCLLAAGYREAALEAWEQRRAYDQSHENWLELQMLRAVLDRISQPAYPGLAEGRDEAADTIAGWLVHVLAEQRRMPRPAAVDAGQLYGEIDRGMSDGS